ILTTLLHLLLVLHWVLPMTLLLAMFAVLSSLLATFVLSLPWFGFFVTGVNSILFCRFVLFESESEGVHIRVAEGRSAVERSVRLWNHSERQFGLDA
ncbi:hypothetical protein PENTCL1PPCAC_25006, partial [Pristionchus entomophagus]